MSSSDMNHKVTSLTQIIVMIMFLGTIFLSYKFITEENPITYPDAPWKTNKEVFLPGESLTFQFIRCASHRSFVSFTQRLVRVDKGKENLQPDIFISGASVFTEAGCNEVVSLPKKIPENIAPGIYRLVLHIQVSGKMRNHDMVESTQDFQIVAHKQSN